MEGTLRLNDVAAAELIKRALIAQGWEVEDVEVFPGGGFLVRHSGVPEDLAPFNHGGTVIHGRPYKRRNIELTLTGPDATTFPFVSDPINPRD